MDSLVLMRNWFDTPGWSTSWIAAAKMAARISRSVKTAWERKRGGGGGKELLKWILIASAQRQTLKNC